MGGAAPDSLIGRVIGGRFKITGVIARGGMGKVYRAEQAPLGRVCAVKVLNPGYAGEQDPEFHKRFFLEASIASKLTHPNTVTVFDYGRDGDVYFMAMEYLEGQTLHRAIRDAGYLPEDRAVHIARQICRSLREAHAHGVIHRDLKPANIFLVEHGDETDYVKVLDFGLVKNVADTGEDLTQTGMFMGSPKYMSPEQIRGDRVDARTDVYALGIILYEMLTGKVPFDRATSVNILMAHVHEEPPPMRETNPLIAVSAAVEEVVARCMAKDPGAPPRIDGRGAPGSQGRGRAEHDGHDRDDRDRRPKLADDVGERSRIGLRPARAGFLGPSPYDRARRGRPCRATSRPRARKADAQPNGGSKGMLARGDRGRPRGGRGHRLCGGPAREAGSGRRGCRRPRPRRVVPPALAALAAAAASAGRRRPRLRPSRRWSRLRVTTEPDGASVKEGQRRAVREHAVRNRVHRRRRGARPRSQAHAGATGLPGGDEEREGWRRAARREAVARRSPRRRPGRASGRSPGRADRIQGRHSVLTCRSRTVRRKGDGGRGADLFSRPR